MVGASDGHQACLPGSLVTREPHWSSAEAPYTSLRPSPPGSSGTWAAPPCTASSA